MVKCLPSILDLLWLLPHFPSITDDSVYTADIRQLVYEVMEIAVSRGVETEEEGSDMDRRGR